MPNDNIEFVPPDEALTQIQEVRYSMPKLVQELMIKRTSSVFSTKWRSARFSPRRSVPVKNQENSKFMELIRAAPYNVSPDLLEVLFEDSPSGSLKLLEAIISAKIATEVALTGHLVLADPTYEQCPPGHNPPG